MLRIDINILFTMINLLILYVLIRKFLFKPVHNILAKRDEEIKAKYADADRTKQDAQALKDQYENSVKELEASRQEKIAAARKDADAEYDRIVADANGKSDAIVDEARKKAQAAADQEKHKAEEEISGMVKDAAAKIAEAQSDEKLYDDFLKQVSADPKQEG
ncbi:MAG: ATP synthase F0 subunit B [Lachnospiraceae bacterium]|nr:ATP synthase F0 subunit B [Lachnospiraceae bacterium]